MKRVSFALVLVALLLSFGLANAGFRIEAGTYDESADGCVAGTYLGVNTDVAINVYFTNDHSQLLGWSTPFTFTGTAPLNGPLGPVGSDVETVLAAADGIVDPTFYALWEGGKFNYTESFDGVLPDLYNFSGISIAGWNMVGTEFLVASFTANFTDPGNTDDITTFCIDSGDAENNTYDWLFDPENPFNGPYCWNVKKQCNAPAFFTNCPTVDQAIQFDETLTINFAAEDEEDDFPYVYSMVSGNGAIDAASGVYTWSPECGDLGSHDVEVMVVDAFGGGNPCAFTVTVGNTDPTIDGDCDGFAIMGKDDTKVINFTADAGNLGDALTFSAVSTGDAGLVFDGGELTITSTATEGPQTITVTVTDCGGATAECTYDIEVLGVLPFDIKIEKVHGQLQGHHSYVEVTKEKGSELMHGFDFLIGYDASALSFVGAEGGALFAMPGAYEWEYFTYRYNWNGNCGNGCPSGLLRVVAIADQNDGGHHPVTVDVDNGMTLFTLDFLVTNDRTFECQYAAVYFYWMDCGDNTIAFQTKADATAGILNIQTAVSDLIYHWNGDMLVDPPGYYEFHDNAVLYGFPTRYGIQGVYDELDPTNNTLCFIPEFDQYGEPKPGVVPFINFFNGGVDIVCADDIDARGDVNLNGVENEIADAVVFTNYFIYGLSAFTVSVEGQIAATEINGDGIALSVADLVYLIRVIVGDALPLPKVAPAGTINVASGNVVSVDAQVGAASFTFEGNASVSLADGAAGMELISNYDGVNTYALIYSLNSDVVASGALLNTNANLVKFEAADYNSGAYSVSMIPTDFALAQNYPNPFNPSTVISAAMPVAGNYALSIYNVAGQKVADFSGQSEAGTITIEWDASQHASGIYFYNFKAGSFEDTKKMVLLK